MSVYLGAFVGDNSIQVNKEKERVNMFTKEELERIYYIMKGLYNLSDLDEEIIRKIRELLSV